MDIADITKNSILVTAHPDDEILWFSSILKNVDEILFCFLEISSKQNRTNGRKQTLSEYPLKNISCLEIDESETSGDVDWQNPVVTEYGIEIANNPASAGRYVNNYQTLKHELRSRLKGYHNVITHNPWGEYGNAEHVQIYRVVKDLQNELQFSLWFSNYCSNKSFNLMLEYIISGFEAEYLTFRTDTALTQTLRDLYRKNDAWTWRDDWEWFNEESFMRDKYQKNPLKNSGSNKYGHIFPVNIIKVRVSNEKDDKSRTRRLSFIRRLIGRSLSG